MKVLPDKAEDDCAWEMPVVAISAIRTNKMLNFFIGYILIIGYTNYLKG
jgi:hypothetical protein